MAACNPSSLMADAACFSCLPRGQLDLLKLSLLCRIAQSLDPTMTCNIQALVNDAACFACLPPGMQRLLELQMLCNISGAVTTGLAKSDQVACGAVDPVAAPTGSCSIYYNTVTQAVFIWTGAAWVLKV